MKKLRTLLLLFIPLLLLAQVDTNIKYPDIKKMIQQNDLSEAQQKIDILRKDNKNDHSLLLYQTEIWVKKGENEYQIRNFKNSFEYYKKANLYWPSHPLVAERYRELSGKKLYNYGKRRQRSSKTAYISKSSGRTNYKSSLPSKQNLPEGNNFDKLLSSGNINIIVLDEKTGKHLRKSLQSLSNSIDSKSIPNENAKSSSQTDYMLIFASIFVIQLLVNAAVIFKLFKKK